jgi:hypothetical protein
VEGRDKPGHDAVDGQHQWRVCKVGLASERMTIFDATVYAAHIGIIGLPS